MSLLLTKKDEEYFLEGLSIKFKNLGIFFNFNPKDGNSYIEKWGDYESTYKHYKSVVTTLKGTLARRSVNMNPDMVKTVKEMIDRAYFVKLKEDYPVEKMKNMIECNNKVHSEWMNNFDGKILELYVSGEKTIMSEAI